MVPSGFRRVTSVQDISGGLLTAPKPIQCPSPPLSSPSLSTLARHGKSRSLDDPLCASKASQELSTAVAVSSRYSVPLKTAPIAPSFALADCPPSSTGHSTPSRQQEQNTRPRDRQRRIRFDRATLILELCQQGSLDASTRATDSLEALLNSADAGEPATPSTKVDILAIRTPQQSLSPLHLASTHGHFELVKSLIGRIGNADAVLARDAEGWTPLHCAAAEGKVDIVRELLRSAVEGGCGRELAEARNGDGETASEVADARCRGEVEALLAEAASQAHPRPTEITREGGRNEDSAGCTATADAQTATVRIPSVHQPPTTSASTPLDLSCASDPDFSSVGKSNIILP
ncbi:hypothetical protein DFJ73DRAFT_259308 [Zopfochytrium polystomum]|nr:hypothetical protein DFJ73DRAFT_259308 [Zopfochytrium polystomum]